METQEQALENCSENRSEAKDKKTSQKSKQGICYDEMCKRVLSRKPILAKIMKTCIPEYSSCSIEEIIQCIEKEPKLNFNPDEDWETIKGENTEDNFLNDAQIKFDVLFVAGVPNKEESVAMFINLEAQNDSNPGYSLIKRAIYYCCRMIDRQKNRKNGFKNIEYNNIKKVYSIWVCNDAPADRAGGIFEYSVCEKVRGKCKWREKAANYDLLKVIMVYPEKEYDLATKYPDCDEQLMAMLRVLFTPAIEASDKKCYLAEKCDIIITDELREEVDAMCNLSKGVKEEGRREGLIEGHTKGLLEMALISVKAYVIKHNVTAEQAFETLQVPEELRNKILEQLDSEKLEQ